MSTLTLLHRLALVSVAMLLLASAVGIRYHHPGGVWFLEGGGAGLDQWKQHHPRVRLAAQRREHEVTLRALQDLGAGVDPQVVIDQYAHLAGPVGFLKSVSQARALATNSTDLAHRIEFDRLGMLIEELSAYCSDLRVGRIEVTRPLRRLCLVPLYSGPPLHVVVPLWPLLVLLLLHPLKCARGDRRATKGLCAVCAYDMRGNPAGACPECGGASLRAPSDLLPIVILAAIAACGVLMAVHSYQRSVQHRRVAEVAPAVIPGAPSTALAHGIRLGDSDTTVVDRLRTATFVTSLCAASEGRVQRFAVFEHTVDGSRFREVLRVVSQSGGGAQYVENHLLLSGSLFSHHVRLNLADDSVTHLNRFDPLSEMYAPELIGE